MTPLQSSALFEMRDASRPDSSFRVAIWLRANDELAIDADNDARAIEAAKITARAVMGSGVPPERIAIDERREGDIAFIDRTVPDRRQLLIEDLAFDAAINDPPVA